MAGPVPGPAEAVRSPRSAWMLARPPAPATDDTGALFDALFESLFDSLFDVALDQPAAEREPGAVPTIDYRLEAPKWQFLCRLGERGQVVLHGSADPTITTFEPRQPADLGRFGSQRGVYATTDGIWPIFYAVLDRTRYHGIMLNACVGYGRPSRPGYYFSLDPSKVDGRPWRPGWIYLLPPQSFIMESVDMEADGPVTSTQCVSTVPVVPLARLAVTPADFPFLDDVGSHDDAAVQQRSAADPDGFPWTW